MTKEDEVDVCLASIYCKLIDNEDRNPLQESLLSLVETFVDSKIDGEDIVDSQTIALLQYFDDVVSFDGVTTDDLLQMSIILIEKSRKSGAIKENLDQFRYRRFDKKNKQMSYKIAKISNSSSSGGEHTKYEKYADLIHEAVKGYVLMRKNKSAEKISQHTTIRLLDKRINKLLVHGEEPIDIPPETFKSWVTQYRKNGRVFKSDFNYQTFHTPQRDDD